MDKLQINNDIHWGMNKVFDLFLTSFVRFTWQRVSAVRLFIEHTCPGTSVCHPADIKNAFKLWKVGATMTLAVKKVYCFISFSCHIHFQLLLLLLLLLYKRIGFLKLKISLTNTIIPNRPWAMRRTLRSHTQCK